MLTAMSTTSPTAFISYSWDSDQHRAWVQELAERLRDDGVDVKLDQWDLVPGDQLAEFMERGVREHDFVVIICTPKYRERSDSREGGVGYEGDVMTAELMTERKQRKFIPVWRSGAWKEAAPAWLIGKRRIDLTADPYDEQEYRKLLLALFGNQSPRPAGPRQRRGWITGDRIPSQRTPAELLAAVEGLTEVMAKHVSKPHIGHWLEVDGRVRDVFEYGAQNKIGVTMEESGRQTPLVLEFDGDAWGERVRSFGIGDHISAIGKIDSIVRDEYVSLEDCELVD